MKNKTQIISHISIVLFAVLILSVFPDIRNFIDKGIETSTIKVRGEIKPDSNIIIIHFSEEDIARIGPWPIKRNYYALLINQLSNLGVKKIGLEIFLSSRFVTQSVYDNLLTNEIEKSGRVVLSSVAGNITRYKKNFFTDSLSYPSPKLIDENLLTGHINYLEEYDIEIPLFLRHKELSEKAFAYQISEIQTEESFIEVNFISSWQSIRKYSALEFAGLVFNQSPILNVFKDKIVLIGISDPQISPTIVTPFDNQLPGVGLHFFAIDNLFNSRSINDSYYLISIILFPFLLIGFILIRNLIDKKVILLYTSVVIPSIIVFFILIALLNIKIASSVYLIPFALLIIFESIRYFFQGQKDLKGAIDEATALRNLLLSKENELLKLQNQLNESGEKSNQLTERIETLRNDIEKLKENEDDRLKASINLERRTEDFYGIVYSSNAMSGVIELIKKVAPTDSTILITGESGTGKELVAKAVHVLSKRREKNFIAVNCGALTDSLLESELFGHVRGSFTGATSDKPGRFELADQGTIFLDEIGETTENFQVKILRVLQSGEIEKVGSTKVNKVDVRVIAATNKRISELVKEKKFREDLYYRLNVITIELPALRDRKEDIEALVNYFLHTENSEMEVSKAVLQALSEYQWKGNVRELESAIKRSIIFAKSEKRKLIQLSDLPNEIVKELKYSFEDLVLESLRNKKFSHSSIVETAKELGNVNRTTISENFRGIVFKTLVENDFDIEKTISFISDDDSEDVKQRVNQKVMTFINNIEKDLQKTNGLDFENLKKRYSSKYKNLPARFHYYLDEVIRKKINR